MKFVFVVFCSFCLFCSCADPDAVSGLVKEPLATCVVEWEGDSSRHTAFEYDEEGRVICSRCEGACCSYQQLFISYNEHGKSGSVVQYENGQQCETTWDYSPEGLELSTVTQCAGGDRVVKKNQYTKDGLLFRKDERGQGVAHDGDDSVGIGIHKVVTYEYDAGGKVIKETVERQQGVWGEAVWETVGTDEILYFYSPEGAVSAQEVYIDGVFVEFTTFFYEDGLVETRTVGVSGRWRNEVSVYDEDGNRVFSLGYGSEPEDSFQWEAKYSDAGELLELEGDYYWGAFSSLYEYDEEGVLLSERSWSLDKRSANVTSSGVRYKYDGTCDFSDDDDDSSQ